VLLNYHIGRFVLGSFRVRDLVQLGLSSVRVAGWSLQHGHHSNPKRTKSPTHLCFSLQHGHHSNPNAPNLQHTCASSCNADTTQTQPHQISNTQRTENKTTDVVIQQHSHKLLMMDILMSETCWVHKKWNKIASSNKLVFYSSNTTMMHGPINISFEGSSCLHIRGQVICCYLYMGRLPFLVHVWNDIKLQGVYNSSRFVMLHIWRLRVEWEMNQYNLES